MLVVPSEELLRPLAIASEVSANPADPLLAPAVLSVIVTPSALLETPLASPLTLPLVLTPLAFVKAAPRVSTYPAAPVAEFESSRLFVLKMSPAWMLPRSIEVEASVAAA